MPFPGRTAAALLALAATAAGHAADLRAEYARLVDAPYTTAVAAASRAPVVAWVAQRAGTQTLSVASAPDYRARVRVRLLGDAGDSIEEPVLSPDGRWLSYVRGPDAEPNGRVPNPAGLVAGLERALWILPVHGGAALRIALDGARAAFSPDGRHLAFIAGGRLHGADLPPAGRPAHGVKAKALFVDMGVITEFAWSPDSEAIAFVSHRGSHALTGVYRPDADRVQWLVPSMSYDGALAWAPDARRVAILRRPGRAYTEAADVMRNQPFSIWVADTGSGTGREVYRSPASDLGMQYGYQMRWLADGRVLFLSDRSGYSQLYALAPDTGAVTWLSQGACDVESFAIDASGTRVATTGNCFDRDRREIAVWSAATGRYERASAAGTVASDAVFVGRSPALLCRSATASRPQSPVLLAPGVAERPLDGGAPSDAALLQTPAVVEFAAPDGVRLTGVLFRARAPAGTAPGPAVVFVHGGPIRQMLPGWYPTPYYAYAYAANQQLANHGITVLAVNYRTGVGFGRAFREVSDYGPHGIGELKDVLAAAEYLRSLPGVDAARIGIYGGSYGGHLAANALARHSDLFRAGVVWHGIYDFTQSIENRSHPNRLEIPWGVSERGRDLALESSALAHVATWAAPTLIVGGDDDRNVDFAEAVNLVRALEAAGHPPRTLVLPNEVHGFLRHASWLDVIAAGNAFLIEKLAAGEPRR